VDLSNQGHHATALSQAYPQIARRTMLYDFVSAAISIHEPTCRKPVRDVFLWPHAAHGNTLRVLFYTSPDVLVQR
jgi:hypothetical protein